MYLVKLDLCLPLLSDIVCHIIYQTMNHYYPEIMDMHIDSVVSIGTEIALIFLSMICRYGAEMETNKD
ncbi:MAG: hypothetical protein KBT48_06610 [Firmicutes bacterium]|nr:hypothetical protein [Bacillota bacterium]